MRKGNILLVHFKWCPVGFLIRFLTKSYWNHVAWFLDDKTLIESIRGNIRVIPISNYANKVFYNTKIVKISKIDPITVFVALLEAQARKTYKKSSYWKHLLTILSISLKIKGFHLSCSGFIANCLELFDIKFNNKPSYLITPEDINKSEITEDL